MVVRRCGGYNVGPDNGIEVEAQSKQFRFIGGHRQLKGISLPTVMLWDHSALSNRGLH